MKSICKLLFLMVLLFAAKETHAQKKFQETREFGVMVGTSYYIGDLNPYRHFGGDLSVGAGAMYRENLNKRWSIKGQVFYGMISASDADSDDAWAESRKWQISEAELVNQTYDTITAVALIPDDAQTWMINVYTKDRGDGNLVVTSSYQQAP